MATPASHPASPVPVRFVSATHARVPSASFPGTYHNVRKAAGRWVCDADCRGFAFRGVCRHTIAVAAAEAARRVRTCERPGCYDIAREGSCYCSDRCRNRALTAAIPAVEPAPAIPAFVPTATCFSCQQPYPYSDASYQTRLYCASCRHEPVRAGHGWDARRWRWPTSRPPSVVQQAAQAACPYGMEVRGPGGGCQVGVGDAAECTTAKSHPPRRHSGRSRP